MGVRVKDVTGRAEFIVAADDFHGRTTTIVSFSARSAGTRSLFTQVSRSCPTAILRPSPKLSTMTRLPFSLSPFRVRPAWSSPDGYLTGVSRLSKTTFCSWPTKSSGLGRTGETFAVDHEGVQPEVLGKVLGGGIVPVSAVAAGMTSLVSFSPASTAPPSAATSLSCAVRIEVIKLLEKGGASADLGKRLHEGLETLVGQGIHRYADAACGPGGASTPPS